MDNELIGTNVRHFRGEMPQRDLASQMRKNGHDWHQQTVGKVEAGLRPLRLNEASTVANILSISVLSLLGTEQPAVEQLTAEVARLNAQVAAIKDVVS